MNPRERLQYCYELAFYPPRLNELSRRILTGTLERPDEVGALLDTARTLHLALPSGSYSSQRSLRRLALYQADARAFGMVRFIEGLRRRLNRPALELKEVPGELVRDIGLPSFCHHRIEATQPWRGMR